MQKPQPRMFSIKSDPIGRTILVKTLLNILFASLCESLEGMGVIEQDMNTVDSSRERSFWIEVSDLYDFNEVLKFVQSICEEEAKRDL